MSPEEVKRKLAELTADEAGSIYFYRCRGIKKKLDLDDVLRRTPGIGIGASSAYTRTKQAMRLLGIDDEQLANVYCPVLLEMVGETPDFRNWPPAVETVVTGQPETVEAASEEEEPLLQEPEDSDSTVTEGQWEEIPSTQETDSRTYSPPPLIVQRNEPEDFPQERPAWLPLATIFVTAVVLLGAGAFLLTRLLPGEEEPAFADEPPPTDAVFELGESDPTQQPAEIASATSAPTSPTPEPTLSARVAHMPTITPTATVTPTPTETPTATPTPLFFDDFSSGYSDQWDVLQGEPFVVNQTLTFNSDTVMVIDADWSDYVVSFEASNFYCQQVVTSRDVAIGLRYQDLGNMIAVRLWHHSFCGAGWWTVESGTWEMIQNSHAPLPGGSQFRITVSGNTFSVSGGNEIFLDTVATGGVALIASEGMTIDNFKVEALN